MVENSDKTEDSPESQQSRTSCVKYFDALWFCYSPVHQLKRYYVYGDVDDCLGHWSKLMACLRQKTRFRDEDDAIHRDGEACGNYGPQKRQQHSGQRSLAKMIMMSMIHKRRDNGNNITGYASIDDAACVMSEISLKVRHSLSRRSFCARVRARVSHAALSSAFAMVSKSAT
eukprot:jgi/Picre1/27166/NNA_000135.t1